MVALVSGNSLGLNLTSLATLGARGVAGTAAIGRGTDRAYVNVANGNLVIQNRDDALAAPGPWIDSLRTYNSQEHLGGDHRLPGLQPPRLTTTGGIANVNSSIVRKDADGGEDLYLYDFNRAAYISTDGAGAYDTIRYVNSQLVWTDGDTGLTEYYARYQNEWQLVLRQDSDGNAIRFAYNKDGQVASAIDNAGEGVYYDYANRLLAQVRSVTIAANGSAQTVRVRYGYDSFSRLSSVTVDLSPEDGSITDGRVYVTRYEYDGPSDRITAVRESDGSSLTIAYVGAGNDSTRHARALTDAQRSALVAGGIAASWRPAPSSADGVQTQRYDLLDRLIASTDISGTVTRPPAALPCRARDDPALRCLRRRDPDPPAAKSADRCLAQHRRLVRPQRPPDRQPRCGRLSEHASLGCLGQPGHPH
jgi:YD repeat-containing protein